MTQPNSSPSMPTLTSKQWALLGVAVLAFIFTFLPFEGISVSGISATENAWHGVAVVGSLAVILALIVVLASLFARSSLPDLPIGINVLIAGLAALAFIFYIIRWLTLPSYSGFGFHYGLSLQWAGYVLIILCAILAILAFMAVRDSGESMPWENRGTAGGMGGGTAPPPPPPTV